MVAYSFKKQFAPKIMDRSKTQTIRAPRKPRKGAPPVDSLSDIERLILGHVKSGQAIQLYTGMRTVHCRKIGDATCKEVLPITLHFKPVGGLEGVEIYGDLPITGQEALDAFARLDGFDNAQAMAKFWLAEHGWQLRTWAGVIVRWWDFIPA